MPALFNWFLPCAGSSNDGWRSCQIGWDAMSSSEDKSAVENCTSAKTSPHDQSLPWVGVDWAFKSASNNTVRFWNFKCINFWLWFYLVNFLMQPTSSCLLTQVFFEVLHWSNYKIIEVLILILKWHRYFEKILKILLTSFNGFLPQWLDSEAIFSCEINYRLEMNRKKISLEANTAKLQFYFWPAIFWSY